MEIQKNSGIVLTSGRAGESDSICTILTRESGKRNFIFKGLKKSKKRPLSADSPGTFIEILYYYHPGKNYQIANEFTVKRNLNTIRKDLHRIYHLFFLLEIIEKTTGYNEQNTQLYDTTNAAIATLETTDHPILLSAFLCLHLLKFQGIFPADFRCKKCRNEFSADFILDLNDLLPVCSTCTKKRSAPILGSSAISFLKNASMKKFRELSEFKYSDDDIKKLLFSMLLFMENYYSIEIKSKRFILSE